jgi:low temperature requirement protein LtrA
VNVQRCGLHSFTLADVPYACFDFAMFIFFGRMVVVVAWLLAAIGVEKGKPYCIWRVIAAFVPGVFYLGAALATTEWLAMPLLWFLAIGLDIVLHLVPSTIVWPWAYIPRHTHFTEERHAMVYIVALGEMIIAAGIPIDLALPEGGTIGQRYGVMFSVTILSFFLCIQNFVASDTAKLEHHGGKKLLFFFFFFFF